MAADEECPTLPEAARISTRCPNRRKAAPQDRPVTVPRRLPTLSVGGNAPGTDRDDLLEGEAALAHPAPGVAWFGELRQLWVLARLGWSRGVRPWVGLASAAATVCIYLLLRNPAVGPELWRSGSVFASLPLSTELARLPMSLLLPTPYLPVWAACGQLLVVIGLGELILGRFVTVVVALGGHFAATLVARVLLDTVHGSLFGLTPALVHALDTGPSAAAVAVGACLLVVARMPQSATLLAAALIAAALIAPGVDGVEHTVALAFGLAAGGVYLVAAGGRRTSRPRHGRTGQLTKTAPGRTSA
jgi:hypothetical protein